MLRKIFLPIVLFCLVLNISLYAQEEDPNWFWGKIITDISFEGLKNVKQSELVGVVSGFIEKKFTDENYADLVDRLYALEMFDDIEPYAKHDGKSNDRILLVFKVVERPIISKLTFSGNKKLRGNQLTSAITVKRGDIFSETKTLQDERALREFYLKKGFGDAVVSHRTTETEDGIELVFVVNEGGNTVIGEINFQGNTIVSERTLKRKITLKEVGFLKDGAFQRSTLEADKLAVASYYHDKGYIDAKVVDVLEESSFNEKKSRTELKLTFIVSEGAQYVYGGTTLSGNTIFDTDKLLSYIKLDVGKVFNQTKFQEGMQGIISLYAESGYMTNQYTPSEKKDAERKVISFAVEITERTRSHIENIIIKGNTKTKEYVIRREIPIQSGDVFSREKLMQGIRNLYNLQYFSSIIPEPVPGSEADLVDLVISVEEQSTTTLEFGMTFSAVSDPGEFPISLFAKWQNSNLKGEGRTISFGTNLSNTEQSVTTSYGQNWIYDLPIGFSTSLSFSHSTNEALRLALDKAGMLSKTSFFQYGTYAVSLGAALGRRWNPSFAILTVNGGINISIADNIYDEKINVPMDPTVNANANRLGLINSIWGSVSLDNRDLAYDPSRGWFVSEKLTWFGLIPKVEKEFFLRSDLKLEGYVTLFNIPVTEKWSFKSVLAAYTGLSWIHQVPGTMLGDGNKLFIDGMFNGRGWSSAYNVRGKAMLSNQVEIRFPLFPGIIGIDGFFDAIVVKENFAKLFTDVHADDWYFSFGPGLRFLLPQFPLHLMWAWGFKYDKGRGVHFKNSSGEFVLSFNIVNR